MMIDELMKAASAHVKHRLWLTSDLQQQYPDRARYCMTRAVDDFTALGLPVEAVCHLGDATEGKNLPFIQEMAQMQFEQYGRVDAPKFYTVGNHDFDYFSANRESLGRMCIPFVEFMQDKPGWHVPADCRKMHYIQDMGDYALCFLTDHADPAGRWHTTHGVIRGDAAAYPYTLQDYRAVMDEVAALDKPVITLSHYSFPGGNRESELYRQFLPLPKNIRLHIYGHAHIGDARWAGKDCYRQISAVDNQSVVQINVASLENFRGSAIRSAVLEWYDTDEIGIYFRNHTQQCWDGYLVLRAQNALYAPPLK